MTATSHRQVGFREMCGDCVTPNKVQAAVLFGFVPSCGICRVHRQEPSIQWLVLVAQVTTLPA